MTTKLDYDDIKLQTEIDSEEEARLPSTKSQNYYDFLKFTGTLIYQAGFCAMIGQVKSANFASKELVDLFKAFLILRPAVIVFFTVYTTLLAWHRARFTMGKLREQKRIEIATDEQLALDRAKAAATPQSKGVSDAGLDKANLDFVHAFVYDDDVRLSSEMKVQARNPEEEISYEHPEIPDGQETALTMVMLPLAIYGGFGRSVMISEKRSTLLLMSHAQEVLLHAFPLGMILVINVQALSKLTILDIISLALLAMNIFEVFVEILVLKIYENVKINLELKNALKSQTRTIDLFKIWIVSALFLTVTVLVGFFAVPKGTCVQGFFLENNICKNCRTYVDYQCVACSNRFSCDECQAGYFGVDKDCIACSERFGPQCLECTAGGCTKCATDFFIREGKCEGCLFMKGCADESSCPNGCRTCYDGYYLDSGLCLSCS